MVEDSFDQDQSESKYIDDPKEVSQSIEEYVQEFKDLVFPAYASFGLTLAEALLMHRTNSIYNGIADILDFISKDKWEK